ncbi:cysteine-rich repeat secretory protein 38-like [Magnolia sinica]|uniref:cysteine-rich repeat secretory protein 38-like n=1 Tax=Magnolia sinica TaxID=86752 RepID=UPI002658B9A6|nr:cysteine-rich repeat secretory protein 38-like [Magnolia sinica]
MAHQSGRINGLAQCQPNLSSSTCNLCVQTAKDAVTDLCPNSSAATAWFDGCYIHYYYHTSNSTHEIRVYQSRSNRTHVTDRTHFAYALDALLLRLTADVHLPSRRGFSSGIADYGDGRRVYGLAECLEFVTLENCVACVTRGARELHECCGGSAGGTVVAGSCLVRFESYQFFSSGGMCDAGSDSSGPITSYDEMDGDDCRGFKVKVVWAWSVGVACFVGVVLGVWMLRRKIISVKVATYPLEISEEKL